MPFRALLFAIFSVLQCTLVLCLCPQISQIQTVYLSDSDIQAGASVTFPVITFNMSGFSSTTPIFNTSTALHVTCEPGSPGDGLLGSVNPQGLCGRYSGRIANEASTSFSLVPLLTNANLTLQAVILRSPLPTFAIQGDEVVDISLPGQFFGNATSCSELIMFGRVVVASSYTATWLSTFLSVTVYLSMIVGGVLGAQSPSKAIDSQTMVMLGTTTCAAPKENAVLSSYRALSPFAFDKSVSGMLLGNAVIVGLMWLVWAIAVLALSKIKKKEFDRAAATLYFPNRPFAISMVLFQGLAFTAFRGICHGIVAGSGGLLGGGAAVAVITVLFPVGLLYFVYQEAAVQADFHLYSTANMSVLYQMIFPRGKWGPRRVIKMFGSLVLPLQRPERFFVSAVMWSPLVMGLVASFEPQSASGCYSQYVVLLVAQLLFSLVPASTQLYRTKLTNLLAVCSSILITITAAIIAVSAHEQIAAVSLEIPVVIFCIVTLVRNVHDLFVTYVERTQNELSKKLFQWYTKEQESAVFERDDSDSISLGSDDGEPRAPVENALLHLPSVMNKEALDGNRKADDIDDLFAAIDSDVKSKKSNSSFHAATSDPFADDDPFADIPKANSFAIKPSALKEDVDDPFADPFAGLDEESPKKAKLKGLVKKTMLAAALKTMASSASDKKEQQDMFGDVTSAKPDFLRPTAKVEQQDDFIQDMLRAAGVNEASDGDPNVPKENPMLKAGLNASAFSKNTSSSGAKKEEPKDMMSALVKRVNIRHLDDDEVEDPRKEYVLVYRIEEEKLVKQPKAEFGTFFDGDTYVTVRHRIVAGTEIPKDSEYEFFVWIGKSSTADEYTSGLERVVEKDEACPSDMHPLVFTGGFRIHRLEQGHESSAFLAQFPGQTITVKEGGIDARGVQPKLFHVHGSSMRSTKMTQVSPSWEALDEDDVFVLDAGQTLYVFQGTDCSPMERMAGGRFAQDFATNRVGGRVQVVTSGDAPEEFWVLLGTTKKKVKSITLKRADDLHPSTVNRAFRVKGDNSFELIATGREVSTELCKSNLVMILDMCSIVYVWVGKDTSGYAYARSKALMHGWQYLKKHSESSVPLVRVIEGYEGSEFDEMFL